MNKAERVIIVLILFLLGLWLLYPTFKWSVLTSESDREIASMQVSAIAEKAEAMARENAENDEERERLEKQYRKTYKSLKNISQKSVKLGLDLRGGSSVLLEADREATEKRRGSLSDEEFSQGMSDDVELLRARVDEFGTSEVDVHSQSNNQIVVEIPGTNDIEQLKSILNGAQSLNFAIVDYDKTSQLYLPENNEKFFDKNDKLITDVFQEGFSIHPYYDQDDLGLDVLRGYYVIDETKVVDASTNYIQSVTIGRDDRTGRPTTNFVLSKEGGEKFYELTSRNVGGPLAVLLNGRIKSVATINEALSTNVQVTTGSEKDAQELSKVLKSSALPIDLRIISSSSIGASLGDDAVSQILLSSIIGLGILAVFMICYYHLCGILSVLMMLFNMFLLIASLASLGLTLSLTSIAGIILTIGMAADSSIIIFERIKEELNRGVIPYNAVSIGYKRARLTILDANITTMIAAIVLSTLGSTSVKGFANTLAIGIICTLITMLFSSHIIIDLFVREKSKFVSVGFISRRKK